MDYLPAEVLQHLLLFLMPEEVGELSLVCKRWAITTSKEEEFLWRTLYLRCFGGSGPQATETWKDACAKAFSSLYMAVKAGETTLEPREGTPNNRYKKIVDFILGGNYSQEEVQGLCRLPTLSAVVDLVAKQGLFEVLRRIARHVPSYVFRRLLPQAFLNSSEGGHVAQLEWILSLEPRLDINQIFQLGPDQYTTALLAACRSQSLEAARFLLGRGAKTNVTTRKIGPAASRRWTIITVPCPVAHAVTSGYTEMAKALISHILTDPLRSSADKARAAQEYLEEAVRQNHVGIAEFLLAQKDYCAINGTTGLFSAEGVSIPLVPLLAEEEEDQKGLLRLRQVGPAVFHAAMQGHVDMMRFLISKGADVNMATAERRTALHVGCYYGQPSVVQLLLENGATIDSKTVDGATPLSITSWKGHKAVMAVLQQELSKRKGKG